MSILLAIVILVIFAVCKTVLSAVELPLWPFVFFVFPLLKLCTFDWKGWLDTTVGGLIGLLVGFLFQILSGGSSIWLIAYLVGVIAIITLVVDGRFRFTNKACLFMVTAMTIFGDYPSLLNMDVVVPVFISFLIAVVLFALIIFLKGVLGKKKAQIGCINYWNDRQTLTSKCVNNPDARKREFKSRYINVQKS